MHRQVLEFSRKYLTKEEILEKRILEVGSRNVNGSVRPDVLKLLPMEYIGSDIESGKDVDVICNADNLVAQFGEQSFDVVISTEMLEHAEHWQLAISNMKRVCKPGGILLITTRSKRFHIHDYPGDYWRYEMDDMPKLFVDCEILVLEKDAPNDGVLMKARKPLDFQEKDLSEYKLFSIIDFLLERNRPMARFIYQKFGKTPLIGAEIGVAGGGHARYMMQLLRLTEFHLIDIWEDYQERNRIETRYSKAYEQVKTNFGGYKNIIIHRADSIDKSKEFPGQYFDFVYIDANHTRVKQDIAAWLPKVKNGGAIGGHDYTSGWPEVKEAVDWWNAKLKVEGKKFEFYNEYPDWWFVKV